MRIWEEVINIQERVEEHELRHEIDDEERQRLTRDIDTMKSLFSSPGEEKTALGKIDQLIMENQALRSSRDEIRERNLALSSENETLQQQIQEMKLYRDEELDRNRCNFDEMTKQNDALQGDLQESHKTILEMGDRLTEFQTWSKSAQCRLVEIESNKNDTESQLRAAVEEFNEDAWND